MISKVIKSDGEFELFKEMFTQDSKNEGKKCWFDDDEPPSYPCLIKVIEIENMDVNINFDEFEDIEEAIENLEEGAEIETSYIYDFFFITKNEIEELLNA